MSPIKPKYYECGICDCIHPWDWNGDCREDESRFSIDELDERHHPYGWELLTWGERLAEDFDARIEETVSNLRQERLVREELLKKTT